MLRMKKTLLIIAASVVMVAMCTSLWAADAAASSVTLTVGVYDRSTPGYLADNNFMTKYIQDGVKAKYGFTVKFQTIPRWQEVPKLNLLMAAGKAPDVSFMYDLGTVSNYIKSKGLVDLTQLLDQYGPELKAYLGSDVLDYGFFDGKQWAIPAKRTNVATFSAFVRKDWLDKLGMKMPTSTQGFLDMLKAFKDKNPGNVQGEWGPWVFQTDQNNIKWTVSMFIDSYIPKLSPEDSACYLEFATPGWKDAFKALNKAYNDGLIEPQFTVDKDGKLLEKAIMQGKAGAFIWNWDYPYRPNPGLTTELKKVVSDANIVPFDPFVDAQGKHAKMKYNPNGLFIFVPRFSKHAKEAIQYLNWMADIKNLKFLQNGVKGQQYTDETAGGIPKGFIDSAKLPDAQKYNFSDLPIISNGKEFGSDALNAEALALSYSGYEELVKQAYIIAMTDATFPFHFEAIIDASAKYTPIIRTKGAQLFAKSIVCAAADFDKTWDSLYKEWYEAGADKIIAERRVAYKAQMAKAKK